MSNCIEIKKGEVIFTKEEFDIDKFLKDKEFHSSKEHSESYTMRSGKKSFPLDCTFCWFLRSNSFVDEKGNLHIKFGKGQSSHTQRDFSQTIRLIIGNYIRVGVSPKRHTFTVFDEFDGFESADYVTVEFSKEWQAKEDEEHRNMVERVKKMVDSENFKIKVIEKK